MSSVVKKFKEIGPFVVMLIDDVTGEKISVPVNNLSEAKELDGLISSYSDLVDFTVPRTQQMPVNPVLGDFPPTSNEKSHNDYTIGGVHPELEKNRKELNELMDEIIESNQSEPAEDTKECTSASGGHCKDESYFIRPSYYNEYSKEVIDMMVDIWGFEKTAIFCELNAFKYRMRIGLKNKENMLEDLKKEQFYLDRFKELSKMKISKKPL